MFFLMLTILILAFSPLLFYSYSKTGRRGPRRALWCMFAAAAVMSCAPHPESAMLDVFWGSLGGGGIESGYSLPFALETVDGRTLEHVAQRASSSGPYFILVKYLLVSLIAGGVTAILMWFATAAAIAFGRGIRISDAFMAISNGSIRKSLSVLSAGWILFNAATFLVRDWHILGTTAFGEDFFFIAVEFSALSFACGIAAAGVPALFYIATGREALMKASAAAGAAASLAAGAAALLPQTCPFVYERLAGAAPWQTAVLAAACAANSAVWALMASRRSRHHDADQTE